MLKAGCQLLFPLPLLLIQMQFFHPSNVMPLLDPGQATAPFEHGTSVTTRSFRLAIFRLARK
jgi:hypothetical protein